MDTLAFLVDITGHLNDLNVKLQGRDNSVCDLVLLSKLFRRSWTFRKQILHWTMHTFQTF